MCQQILQFCSGSTKPLLLAGGLLSLLLAIAIGYTGYTTNALYSEIDSKVADSRALGYHLQLGAAVYLILVTVLSSYLAFYDQKHSIRVLFGLTTLQFFIALVAIFMIPYGAQVSQPFEDVLKQAATKYNFSDKAVAPNVGGLLQNFNVSVLSSASLVSAASTANLTRPARWIDSSNKLEEMSMENATRIWDNLQARGCCGLTNGTQDWTEKFGHIPKSCCADAVLENESYQCKQIDPEHQRGCLALIETTSLNLLIVLALIALVNFYLATISGISAYKTYSYSEASQNAYT